MADDGAKPFVKWEIAAKAVVRQSAPSNLKKDKLDRYVEENWRTVWQEWMDRNTEVT